MLNLTLKSQPTLRGEPADPQTICVNPRHIVSIMRSGDGCLIQLAVPHALSMTGSLAVVESMAEVEKAVDKAVSR